MTSAQATNMSATPSADRRSDVDIEQLRSEIDRLDAQILAAIQQRTELSRLIGEVRMLGGGTRLVHTREMRVLSRFDDLGPEGHTLALLLLRLGAGASGSCHVTGRPRSGTDRGRCGRVRDVATQLRQNCMR
ncbi:chorismate mutase [Rhodococcus hoagii]|nr:chorismate mutase [Prescottella equi]